MALVDELSGMVGAGPVGHNLPQQLSAGSWG